LQSRLGSALCFPVSVSQGRTPHFGGIHLNPIEGVEDFWHATDAYIYGYPLVTVEMTDAPCNKAKRRRDRP